MEAISFGQVVRHSWRDAWGFVKRQPGMSLAVAALLLLSAYVNLTLAPGLDTPIQPGMHPSLSHSALLVLLAVVQIALKIGLTVQVCRYVLLDEASRHATFFGKPFWRYVGTALAGGLTGAGIGVLIAIVAAIVAIVVLGVHGVYIDPHTVPLGLTLALIAVLLVLLIATIVVLFAPMTLLLVHAAANRKFEWRAARRDARGHFWSMLGAYIVTTLPIMILSIPMLLLIPASLQTLRSASGPIIAHPGLWYGATLAQTLLSLLFLFLSAACSAWLYRRFASQLLPAA